MNQQIKKSEYRSIKFETRVEEKQEGGKKLVLRGYPILFNTETEIFDFWYGKVRETILPTALDGTDLTDVYLVTGHNIEPDKVLARNNINMRLEVDDTGLFFECELPNTQHARDIYNLIDAGIVDGMSFGFTCSDEVNPETLVRTITHIDELFEITITPFPAYKEASVIAQRTKQAQASENEAQRDIEPDVEQEGTTPAEEVEAIEDKLDEQQEQIDEQQQQLDEHEEKIQKLEELLND